jgi:hypothetical protein
MGRIKHFCHLCNLYFHKAVDFTLHHNQHVQKGKLEAPIVPCKQCNKGLTEYHRTDNNWDIIGGDDNFVHGEW